MQRASHDTYLYKKGILFVGSSLAQEFNMLVHKSVHFAYQDVGVAMVATMQ